VQREGTAPSEKPREASKPKNLGTGGKVADTQRPEKEKEAFSIVDAVENRWKTLEAVAAPYNPLRLWLLHGNTIVTLIRLHATAALNATQANDSELAAGYLHAVETDKITFDYVVWHVIAYVNLLSLRSSVKGLINSFDHDNRAFTGRKNAERITRELQQAINELPSKSNDDLGLIASYPLLAVRAGKPQEYDILVTTAAIKGVAPVLLQRTADMKKVQLNVQLGAEYLDQWVDEAFKEGLRQAEDALEEYWKARSALGGGRKSQKKKSSRPEDERQPQPPPPYPVKEDEPRRESGDCCPAPMPGGVEFTPRRGKYKAKTLTIAYQGKHVKNALPIGNQHSCDNSYLASVRHKDPASPCLTAWIEAKETKDTANHGSQIGEDSLPDYVEIAQETVEDGKELRNGMFYHDVGRPVGVDVSTQQVTTKALVRDVPNACHIVPQEKA
jgi:hypothetical protein